MLRFAAEEDGEPFAFVSPAFGYGEAGAFHQLCYAVAGVFVAVLGVHVLAGGEGDGEVEGGDADVLVAKALDVHLDARGARVPLGPVGEVFAAEVGAELAVETGEEVEVEVGGDAGFIVIGGEELADALATVAGGEVDAEEEAVSGAHGGADAVEEGFGGFGLKVADAGANPEEEVAFGGFAGGEVPLDGVIGDYGIGGDAGELLLDAGAGDVKGGGGDVYGEIADGALLL